MTKAEKNVPLLDLKKQYLSIKEEVEEKISEICLSQQFILGPEVEAFEEEIARYCQCSQAIGVSSGTDAILLALMSCDIGPGDEVITSPYTFFATIGCISRLGATPVLVDIDPLSYNINPKLIRDKVSEKTKAIMPVHLYGQCAEQEEINSIADEFEAQSHRRRSTGDRSRIQRTKSRLFWPRWMSELLSEQKPRSLWRRGNDHHKRPRICKKSAHAENPRS